MFEFLLAYFYGVQRVLVFFTFSLMAVAVVLFVAVLVNSPSKDKDGKESFSYDQNEYLYHTFKSKWKAPLVLGLMLLPFCLIPRPEDLLSLRISLIKYELSSPENIERGVETIEKIGKKLECKYLGCDEKKE